ncbi:MAG: acyl carrier protein [SAR202 cluster bacterium]|nr:acyl carrier protein [SAR202 cluster bacterium]|tara:strand:- start:10528 stop:10785 length:258 start_codon:yes stop_codon:yes gene_type:complete
MATVFDRVKDVVVDRLGSDNDAITLEASFVDDLNADSLDLVELIMGFEEEFSTDDNQVKITDEDAEKIRTIQDAVDFIKAQGVSD